MTVDEARALIREKRIQRFSGRWAFVVAGGEEPMERFMLTESDAAAADVAEKLGAD